MASLRADSYYFRNNCYFIFILQHPLFSSLPQRPQHHHGCLCPGAGVVGPGAVGDPCGHGFGQLLLVPFAGAGLLRLRSAAVAGGSRNAIRCLVSKVAHDGPDAGPGDGLFVGQDPGGALRGVVELYFQDHRRGLGLIHLIQAGGYLDAPVFARRQSGELFIQPVGEFLSLAAFGADPAFGPAAAPCVAVQSKVQIWVLGVGIGHHLLQGHVRPVPV